MTIDRGCGVATCGSCSPTSCPPVACLNQSIPATGLSRDWDETQWVGSTCGATDLACVGAHCVPAGKYKAKMCALKNTTPGQNFCTVGDTPVCTEVQFELPTTATTVTGTIGG